MVELAVEELHKAGQPMNRTSISALSATFTHLVSTVQASQAGNGRTNPADGMATRLRGALRTCLEIAPLPFGQDETAWDAWVAQASKRMTAISLVAADMFDGLSVERPCESIAAACAAA
jgi:putative RecB family exonuclease